MYWMHFGKFFAGWLVGVWTVAGADLGWHTSPEKWTEPRVYHRPFEDEFASRIILDHCTNRAATAEHRLAPNKAYWFALIQPDRTKSGLSHSEVLVYTERDYLLRVGLRDVHYFDDIGWISEKLLRLRVWWGRICATDLIVDVERELIIYREMAWDGGIAFHQWQDAKKSPRHSAANAGPPMGAVTNWTPSKPVQSAPDLSRTQLSSFLAGEARAGETYEIRVYVVKTGDTLPSIAKRHGLSRTQELVELNPESADQPLTVGQQIRIYEKARN